eukprot:6495022-Prymnesium_polylepis.1
MRHMSPSARAVHLRAAAAGLRLVFDCARRDGTAVQRPFRRVQRVRCRLPPPQLRHRTRAVARHLVAAVGAALHWQPPTGMPPPPTGMPRCSCDRHASV